MTVRYKVDLGELQRVIDSLQAFGGRLDAQLAELDRANGDLHVTWEGEAAAAQTEAHRKLAQGAREVHQALLAMHEAARRAHASYKAAAQANVQTWKQVR
ncbi:MAG TPA: WXG100 family type VII secretion target [Nocardioides sp.]|uniref:WXG100 family type VII secretion target n=1 Tax=Nocardioides sp. TaxID=35761 RepID=UPI002F3E9588